jgi:hypothetical protein
MLINGKLPKGVRILGFSTGTQNSPILISIGSKLSKLSATSIKDENGKRLPVFDATGGWFSYAIELSKDVVSPESFYSNVVNNLYRLLHENNHIPEEFRNRDVKRYVDYMRIWHGHDTHTSDIKDSETKKERAISVVWKYFNVNKLPEELSISQLDKFKEFLLGDVNTYLQALQEYITANNPVYRPPQ